MRRIWTTIGAALLVFGTAFVASAAPEQGPAQGPVQAKGGAVQGPVQAKGAVQGPIQAKHVQGPAQKHVQGPEQSPVQKGGKVGHHGRRRHY
jgi:hypothetical protein